MGRREREADVRPMKIDIMPIRRGHILVVPKAHFMRLSDLPEAQAGALGAAVSKVCNALVKGIIP